MRRFFPFLSWLLHYQKTNLKGDVSAGLTVAMMLIPQAMAVALLAGLPPIMGLYASVVPLLVYAFFATSRHVAIGPVALISMMVATGVSKLAAPGSTQYILYATVLAGMVGCMQFGMGALNVGFLVNFLSYPVISGFTSAAAVIIAFSQLKHLLGIALPESHYIHEILIESIARVEQINTPTLLLGTTCILLLAWLRKWKTAIPGAPIVVALAAFLVWALDLQSVGVTVLGDVPPGLQGFTLPPIQLSTLSALAPIAIAIALVAFMESIAVAKNFAARYHYDVDANQELIALGLANISASVFGGYPVTAGFSRTAVNVQAGARTGLASIITSLIVALTLMFLTGSFHYMPTVALAAIIVVAVTSLIDFKQATHLFKVKRTDLISWIVTFVATLSFGIEKGILLSIATSLVLVVRRTTRPHCAVLGRLPGTKVYRNVERYPEAITLLGVILIRIDTSLYFANVNFLKEKIQELVQTSPSRLSAIIFDASSVNDIDSSADTALHEIADNLHQQGIKFYFTNVKGPVRDVLQRSGFYDKLGEDHFFFRNHDAVKYFLDERIEVMNETPGGAVKHKAGAEIL
ncbi:MAG: SulP family inorganic anion transporter [bacterium]